MIRKLRKMPDDRMHHNSITPTRSSAVLDIGHGVTLFANQSVITVDGTEQVNHRFEIERIHNIQYVRIKPGIEGDGLVYKKMIVTFYDKGYVERFECTIITPTQWLPRTFLLFLIESIKQRRPQIISVMTQIMRDLEMVHHYPEEVDINSILAGYIMHSVEDQLDMADYSIYDHYVVGGIH